MAWSARCACGSGASVAVSGARSVGPAARRTYWSLRTPCCVGVTLSRWSGGADGEGPGDGHRRIATDLGRPASTVRGWLRRFGVMAGALREHFARWAHALDPGHDRCSPGGSVLFDAVEAVGVLGVVAVRLFGPRSPRSLASVVTGGGLLCNTSSLWARPV